MTRNYRAVANRSFAFADRPLDLSPGKPGIIQGYPVNPPWRFHEPVIRPVPYPDTFPRAYHNLLIRLPVIFRVSVVIGVLYWIDEESLVRVVGKIPAEWPDVLPVQREDILEGCHEIRCPVDLILREPVNGQTLRIIQLHDRDPGGRNGNDQECETVGKKAGEKTQGTGVEGGYRLSPTSMVSAYNKARLECGEQKDD